MRRAVSRGWTRTPLDGETLRAIAEIARDELPDGADPDAPRVTTGATRHF